MGGTGLSAGAGEGLSGPVSGLGNGRRAIGLPAKDFTLGGRAFDPPLPGGWESIPLREKPDASASGSPEGGATAIAGRRVGNSKGGGAKVRSASALMAKGV